MSTPVHYFTTVSPSAKALLLLKGFTTIPYARKAAELVSAPEPYEPDYTVKNPGFWMRVVHFEARYHSINQLLADLPVQNIIELSSGFSFRGLSLCEQQDINYVDTDLPGIIETKRQLISQLAPELKGNLQLLPLNALDEEQFNAIVDRHLPSGPIVIVNEGLLMYLEWEEKQRLCQIIRKILQRRGGYWITADIYLKRQRGNAVLEQPDQLSEFLEKHHVEEKKFGSFEEAEALFREQGLVIDKEAKPDYGSLSTIRYLNALLTPEMRRQAGKSGRIHATWRLRAAE